MISLLTSGDDGLVVFVDDLDRCSPGHVVDTVEAINLLFGGSADRKTIFLLGMDADMIAAGIRVAYRPLVSELRRRGNPAAQDFGFLLLRKIVQVSLEIPPPYDLERYVSHVIGEARGGRPGFSEDLVQRFEEELKQSAETVTELRSLEPHTLQASAEGVSQDEAMDAFREAVQRQVVQRLGADSPDVREAITWGVRHVEPRPRDVKRFINAFKLQVFVHNRTLATSSPQLSLLQIAKWTILKQRGPALAYELKRYPGLMAEFEKIAKSRRRRQMSGNWREQVRNLNISEELKQLLREEPRLAATDSHGQFLVS